MKYCNRLQLYHILNPHVYVRAWCPTSTVFANGAPNQNKTAIYIRCHNYTLPHQAEKWPSHSWKRNAAASASRPQWSSCATAYPGHLRTIRHIAALVKTMFFEIQPFAVRPISWTFFPCFNVFQLVLNHFFLQLLSNFFPTPVLFSQNTSEWRPGHPDPNNHLPPKPSAAAPGSCPPCTARPPQPPLGSSSPVARWSRSNPPQRVEPQVAAKKTGNLRPKTHGPNSENPKKTMRKARP